MENTTNSNPEVVSDTSAPSQHSSSHHSSSHHSSSHHSSSHHSSSHHSSSHHSSQHSSKHSSSKHSSHHSHKRKKKKKNKYREYSKWRKICSFALFLSIAALSAFAGLRVTVLNESKIISTFNSTEYVNALCDDVREYSRDLCIKCSIPEDSADEAVNYENIRAVQQAYTLGNLNLDEMYSDSTYLDMLDKMNGEIVEAVNNSLVKNNIDVDESRINSGARSIADSITEYLKGRVEFKYTAVLQTVVNVSNTLTTIGIVLFAILSVAFLLLTISLTDKKYHAMRSVAFSFFAAAGLNLLLVCFVGIIAIFKDLVLYPSYFCETILRYINSCVYTYLFEGLLLFIAGLAISALTWRLKRDNE